MKEILLKIWKPLLGLIIGIFIGLAINFPSCNKQNPTLINIPVHDTITIDSIRIEEKTKIEYINTIDTFYVKEKGDTIDLNEFPIEYKTYKDTILTDSTSTEINIDYHGFYSEIDRVSLTHNYYNTVKIIPEKKKTISPFVFIEGGPKFNLTFKLIGGVEIGVGAGIYIKDSWGVGASYNLNVGKEIDHAIKLLLYKKF